MACGALQDFCSSSESSDTEMKYHFLLLFKHKLNFHGFVISDQI